MMMGDYFGAKNNDLSYTSSSVWLCLRKSFGVEPKVRLKSFIKFETEMNPHSEATSETVLRVVRSWNCALSSLCATIQWRGVVPKFDWNIFLNVVSDIFALRASSSFVHSVYKFS